MSRNNPTMTVAMAKAANIMLGRDALNQADLRATVMQLTKAFQRTIQTSLTEDDMVSVRLLGLTVTGHGVICGIAPSQIPEAGTSSEWPWNSALEKLADTFIKHGASVETDGRLVLFTVPINSIEPVLLNPTKLENIF